MSVRDVTRLGVRLRSLVRGGRRGGHPENKGPILGRTTEGRPVVWPAPSPERAGHSVILAASGAGKTVMCANALAQEMKGRADDLALLLADGKGDLAAAFFQALAALAPERLADVRVLDPFDRASGFPLNLNRLPSSDVPADIRALQLANLVGEVSTATGAQKHLGLGARQLDVLLHLLLAALTSPHPNANVLWAYDALTEKNGQKLLARVTGSPRARAFLESTKLSDELRVSSAARLRAAFAASEQLERLVSADACVDWAELVSPGRIAMVDLGRPTGGLVALPRFYGNILLRLAVDDLLSRPSPWTGHHVRIVIDEAQILAPVLSDVAETILTTGRSRGVSLTVISQGTTLLRDASDTLLRVLMTNCPTKFIGRLSAPDAELLARELAPEKGVDEPLSALRARFVSQVTNLPDRHFIELTPGSMTPFVSEPVDLDAWNAGAEAHAGAISLARRALALPADVTPRVTLSAVAGKSDRRKRSRTDDEPRVDRSPPDDATCEAAAPETNVDGAAGPSPRSRWG